MNRWEYLTRVFTLDKEDEVAITYIQNEYPDRNWKDLPKFDLLALEAWLNKCGEEGWELVRLEAVDAVGKHGDVGVVYRSDFPVYRNKFLCVFKRPVSE